MSLTLLEVAERLKKLDEITLMEVLSISSEDLVDRFLDIIENKFEQLEPELEDEIDNHNWYEE